jgi:hypothetical protein
MAMDHFENQSANVFANVRKSIFFGAFIGALLLAIASFVFDHLLQSGQGGMGLAIMGGATTGGLVGLFYGLLRSRHARGRLPA